MAVILWRYAGSPAPPHLTLTFSADEIIYYLLGPRRKDELTLAFLTCLDRELDRRPTKPK